MRKAAQCSFPLVKKLVGYKRNISFLDLSERHEIRSLFGHSSLSLSLRLFDSSLSLFFSAWAISVSRKEVAANSR